MPEFRPSISGKDAIEKLEWYALRWKIEVFHKILKSGCRAEEAKLRTAQRLANLIAVYCILSWRVFWMTMLNRSSPDAAPALALTEAELAPTDTTEPAAEAIDLETIDAAGRAEVHRPRRVRVHHRRTLVRRRGAQST